MLPEPTPNGHAANGFAANGHSTNGHSTNGELSHGVSVEAIEEQRARLEADLAAAKARLLAAQHRAADLDAAAKEQLRSELAVSRETLAEIDRQHAETIALVQRNAQAEVDRILADARRRAGETGAADDWAAAG
jgi:hypothetical protein